MIACLDVHYSTSAASAAAIVFERWTTETSTAAYSVSVSQCNDYAPGQFYLRELEPLCAVISQIRKDVSCYIIDGYCHLSADMESGLGARLAEQLPSGKTVIGVAKNRFKDSKHAVEVLRGRSKRPLFVTAVGIDYQDAADLIQAMKGDYRIPTMLKTVDRLSRQTNSEQAYRGQRLTCTEFESSRCASRATVPHA